MAIRIVLRTVPENSGRMVKHMCCATHRLMEHVQKLETCNTQTHILPECAYFHSCASYFLSNIT